MKSLAWTLHEFYSWSTFISNEATVGLFFVDSYSQSIFLLTRLYIYIYESNVYQWVLATL